MDGKKIKIIKRCVCWNKKRGYCATINATIAYQYRVQMNNVIIINSD